MEEILSPALTDGVNPRLMDQLTTGAMLLRAEGASARIDRLQRLREAILNHREALYQAFMDDLGKDQDSVDLQALLPIGMELEHTVANVRNWIRSRRVASPLPYRGSRSEIHVDPKGVVLIMGAWNYPLLLTLGPLISAVAAGCAVCIKPSEQAPAVAAVVEDIVDACFNDEEVQVVQGDARIAQSLTALPFDHIFFTGSTRVGALVMQKAAESLTPVTLELGGKSPTIVDQTADLKRAAERIVWGKFTNSGQTCVATDYIYVHHTRQDALVKELRTQIARLYPTEESTGRIVNAGHHMRLAAMTADAVAHGAKIVEGGGTSVDDLCIEPTILTNVDPNSLVMQEEIFGPILPVLPYTDLSDAIDGINERPVPLAMYVFTAREGVVRRLLKETRSGGLVVNDTVIQYGNPHLPFGGVGASGIGRAHGYWGFLEFSNVRSVLRQRRGWSWTSLLYPPYTGWKKPAITWLLKKFGMR
ncbi:MAG: aldehyde dehydrogenase family protein [Rhodothermales bacterium]|nr:aldehyde dehydrogenase family protein [Rhodothermales bacterium]MBO6780949.1 aldehyde dehydrogenase family protein [Rhodothermales bacterium]